MWDERYATLEFAYGTRPNDFLAERVEIIPNGPVLELGCGEGRNAVFLAERGFEVTAVDQSSVGLAKAQRLAAERGVQINTVQADLNHYEIESVAWAAIVSMWCHVPAPLRLRLHAAVPAGLRPGGVFVLEAYTPDQVGRGTGGPRDPDWMMSIKRLNEELAGLKVLYAQEKERDVQEGEFHNGLSNVVQFIGQRAG
ncbi:MAG: class I SAM-dependent methyltransferase [Planctomycetota bacterium]